MENIFATLAITVSALFASVLAMFGGTPQAPTPQEIAPIVEAIEQVDITAKTEATTAKTSVYTPPTTDPVAEAYKLGKEVGKTEGALEIIKRQKVKEERTLPTNNNTMPEETPVPTENASAGEEVVGNEVTIQITPDKTSVPLYEGVGEESQVTFTINLTSSIEPVKTLPYTFESDGSPAYSRNRLSDAKESVIAKGEAKIVVTAYPPQNFTGVWNVTVNFGGQSQTVGINVGE